MKKALILVLLIIAFLAIGVGSYYRLAQERLKKRLEASANPPVTVSVADVIRKPVAERLTEVGQVVAQQGAMLSAQASGIVTKISFHSGQLVHRGQLLVELNPGPIPGELQEALAESRLAQVDYQRAEKVYAIHGISTAALDKAKYTAAAARAKVTALQESLNDTKIIAPFSGLVGLRKVNLGQYLEKDQPAVVLENLHHLYLDFTLPQKDSVLVHPGMPIQVKLRLGSKVHRIDATIKALSNEVNAKNRALEVRAELPKDAPVKPGMFALAVVPKSAPLPQLLVPTVAVSFNTYGDFVYIVTAGRNHTLVAKQVMVKTGPHFGEDVAITSGLKPGEKVVTAGQVKLRSGDTVRINNAAKI